jgi:hypothetical protein
MVSNTPQFSWGSSFPTTIRFTFVSHDYMFRTASFSVSKRITIISFVSHSQQIQQSLLFCFLYQHHTTTDYMHHRTSLYITPCSNKKFFLPCFQPLYTMMTTTLTARRCAGVSITAKRKTFSFASSLCHSH